MKKIFKGFTLVELIIVMAILVILMAGIMNMFKPIRETYVDSTLYESQRTAQNGVITYITESIRYSTDLGMYTEVKDVVEAVDKFADKYITANNIDSTKAAAVKEAIQKNAEVIVIDNTTTYTFGGKDYKGRILRRKVNGTTKITSAAETAGSSECRLALGDAYYGNSTYAITFGVTQDKTTKDGKAADGINVTVASLATNGLRQLQKGITSSDLIVEKTVEKTEDGTTKKETVKAINDKVISTNGFMLCKNQSEVGGTFDTTLFDSNNATSKDVYIVYLNEKIIP